VVGTDGGDEGWYASGDAPETMIDISKFSKDGLGTARFENLPPKNPTQASMRRFVHNPSLPLETGFSRMKKAWDEKMASYLSTKYDELF
jgi:hypothetical protein